MIYLFDTFFFFLKTKKYRCTFFFTFHRGSFNSQEGSAECSKCSVGRSSTTMARTAACDACTKGTYQTKEGMTACLKCIPGRYQTQENQSECIDCGVGKASSIVGRENDCDSCSEGQHQSKQGTTACLNCIPGK